MTLAGTPAPSVGDAELTLFGPQPTVGGPELSYVGTSPWPVLRRAMLGVRHEHERPPRFIPRIVVWERGPLDEGAPCN